MGSGADQVWVGSQSAAWAGVTLATIWRTGIRSIEQAACATPASVEVILQLIFLAKTALIRAALVTIGSWWSTGEGPSIISGTQASGVAPMAMHRLRSSTTWRTVPSI